MSERLRGADDPSGGAAPPVAADPPTEPPPFLGSWYALYALVLIERLLLPWVRATTSQR